MNKRLAKGFSLAMVVVLGLFVTTLSAGTSARATLTNWLNATCSKNWEKVYQYGVTPGPAGATSYTILKEDPEPEIGKFLLDKDWERQSLDSLRSWLTQAAAAMDTVENVDVEALKAMAYEKQYRERYGNLPDSLLMIRRVDAESSAESAGLEKGDILLTYAGRPVSSMQVFVDVSHETFHKRHDRTFLGDIVASLKKNPHPGMAELVILRAGDTLSIWYPKEGDCIVPMVPLKATIETPSIIGTAKERAWECYRKCQIFGAPISLINRAYGCVGELPSARSVPDFRASLLGMRMTLDNGMEFVLISQGHPDVAAATLEPEDLECMGKGTLVIRNKTFDVEAHGIFQSGAFKGLPWAWHYDVWVARCDRVVNGETILGKWLVIAAIEHEH